MAALRIRNFRLFLIGQVVSSIGTWLHQMAEVWLMLQITDSGLAVGLVVAARFAPVFTLGLWGGALADRRSKRGLLYVTQGIRGLAASVLGVVALAGAATPVMIVLLAVVAGTANAVDNPVRRAFIGELVDDERIFNAVSLNSTVMATSRVVGPVVAGVLIATVGVGWCFIVNAVSFVAVIIALRTMEIDEQAKPRDLSTQGRTVMDGIRYARSDRTIWLPLLMVGLVSASAWNWETLLVLHATRTFGGGAALFTGMFAVLSIGTFVGAMANADRIEVSADYLTLTAGALGLLMLGAAAVPGLAAAYGLLALCGVGAAMFNTASNTQLQRAARGEYHGRVMAIFSAMFVGTKGIGGVAAGGISGTLGPRAGIALGGCGCLGAAAAGRLLDRDARTPEGSSRAARSGLRSPGITAEEA